MEQEKTFKQIIDLEQENFRMKAAQEERKLSDQMYARKDYEKAVRWAIIFLATAVFIAVVNAVTDGIITRLLHHASDVIQN